MDPRGNNREEGVVRSDDLSEIVRKVLSQTPARLMTGRSGAAYPTSTQMELREAHAAARDAVREEMNLFADFGSEFAERWNLFEACSQAGSKDEYLSRPDLGRVLNESSRAEVIRRCAPGLDFQVVIGDGLSVTAMAVQIPQLLPILLEGARARGWSVGQVFVIRHCRVGVLNEIGDLLRPRVAVLLIGERPGLATAESLSAYMAYRPKTSDTDAERNLVSNIHGRGVSPGRAATSILNLAADMTVTQKSGWQLQRARAFLNS